MEHSSVKQTVQPGTWLGQFSENLTGSVTVNRSDLQKNEMENKKAVFG